MGKEATFKYPGNKDFIFTIFDDTDVSTLGNIKPVYDYLSELGILTTKSVWPLRSEVMESDFAGSQTLEDEEYADYIKELSGRGFEIAFHGASMESSPRERTLEALDYFHKRLCFYPRSYACHAGNRENMYWGEERFCFGILRQLYRILNNKVKNYYCGDKVGSAFYWADICYKHIDYVRTFTYSDINLFNVSRRLPYSTRRSPWLKSCFFTSEANNVEEFNNFLCVSNQDRLEREKGVCIVSTHLGKGFVKNGELHPKTKELLLVLAKRNGWFAPVCVILDFLKGQMRGPDIDNFELFKLEFNWFMHSVRRRLRNREYEKTELKYLMQNEGSEKD